MIKVNKEQLKKMIINNEDVTNLDVSAITDMNGMFATCYRFNQDISKWDVSSVTNMSEMFIYCSIFNQNLSNWNVSSVTNMLLMFHRCTGFNQDLSKWVEFYPFKITFLLLFYYLLRY